jgi:hypothetical protein
MYCVVSGTIESINRGPDELEGQTTPYGISLVKADRVWDRTKGAGAKVCIMDTGLYLNQEDFTPKSRFDGAANDAERIYDWVRSI